VRHGYRAVVHHRGSQPRDWPAFDALVTGGDDVIAWAEYGTPVEPA